MYSIYFKSLLINLYNDCQRQTSQKCQLVKVEQSCSHFGQGWGSTKCYLHHICGLRIPTVNPILNRVPFTTEQQKNLVKLSVSMPTFSEMTVKRLAKIDRPPFWVELKSWKLFFSNVMRGCGTMNTLCF